ncbi:cytochrome P450 [Xylaria cubensis]|nr:cytochrome P450 [Xylaria cubensis]
MSKPIPGPLPLPFIGNIMNIDIKNSIHSFGVLSDTYGPIYKLRVGGEDRIIITSQKLVDEVCSQEIFKKYPLGFIRQLRKIVPDGLFTAYPDQESWGIAHRVLLPALGPMAIKEMFPEMLDITTQLILKWARFGPEYQINVPADFTRLTVDTIALCAMDTRLNSFYSETLPPFVDAFIEMLAEAQLRSSRPYWYSKLLWRANQQFDENNRIVHEIAMQVVAKRRANPTNKNDLVDAMINGIDPVTGKGLADETIIDNMITFLIAGHETTSGLLSFLFALILTHPEPYRKLREEIDVVLGNDTITLDHLQQLPYTKACLREALRLQPPSGVWTVTPIVKEPSIPILLDGKYEVRSGQTVLIINPKLHRDPEVWGDDAEEFKPERMLRENFQKLPRNCFKPFGNGPRSCIGSDFAMQEAMIATALLLQKFEFQLVDPDYKLSVRQALTLKPHDFFVYATLRPNINILSLQADLLRSKTPIPHSSAPSLISNGQANGDAKISRSISILYGSNMGTCKALAESLAASANQRGFRCITRPLDDVVDLEDTDDIIVIITASYEGQPPDNARNFISRLANCEGEPLKGIKFALFGCGNRDWHDTFQKIPKLLFSLMEQRGAKPLAPRGSVDVGDGTTFQSFGIWQADHFWPGLAKIRGLDEVPGPADPLNSQTYFVSDYTHHFDARVKSIVQLTTSARRPKFHMEIELPSGTTYNPGAYLEVYPSNSSNIVNSLVEVFKERGYSKTDLGIALITSRQELHHPATTGQLEVLSRDCENTAEFRKLREIIDSNLTSEISGQPSIVQILQYCPSIPMTPTKLAGMLPMIQHRQYSISSSPLNRPSSCTITWSLFSTKTSDDGTPSLGLASSFLASRHAEDTFKASIRPAQQYFCLPTNLEMISTPIIMICAGSGIAPFRAFVEHRAIMLRTQNETSFQLAPAFLFIGCRNEEEALYIQDFDNWQREGAVELRFAYSRPKGEPSKPEYVQDKIWQEREHLVKLWDSGAKAYICGGPPVIHSVREVIKRIYKQVAEKRCGPKTDREIDDWWTKERRDKIGIDAF